MVFIKEDGEKLALSLDFGHHFLLSPLRNLLKEKVGVGKAEGIMGKWDRACREKREAIHRKQISTSRITVWALNSLEQALVSWEWWNPIIQPLANPCPTWF